MMVMQTNTKKVCASMQHSDAQLDEAYDTYSLISCSRSGGLRCRISFSRARRTGIFWRHCYELENLVTDGVIAEDKLTISAEIKIESCTLLD